MRVAVSCRSYVRVAVRAGVLTSHRFPMISACVAVMSGAGPRAVGTEREPWERSSPPHGRLLHTKYKLKSRPGPLSSSTVVTPHLTLPKLLRGTRDR